MLIEGLEGWRGRVEREGGEEGGVEREGWRGRGGGRGGEGVCEVVYGVCEGVGV